MRIRKVLAAALPLSAAAAMAGLTSWPSAAATQTQFYVSPSGNDNNAGTQAAPFRTLTKAQTAVRAINAAMTGDIIVNLASGTYAITTPLQLTAADSGKNGYTVKWQGQTGATPIISGSVKITSWVLDSSGRWVAPLPAGFTGARQLYVNGVRATLAQQAITPSQYTVTITGLTTTDPALAAVISLNQVEVVMDHHWKSQRCPVQSLTQSGSTYTIVMSMPCWHDIQIQGPDFVAPSVLAGAPKWVNAAGEFATNDSYVYYWPRTGEDMFTADVDMPVAQGLIVGGGDATTPLQNVSFKGIAFKYATWSRPDTPSGYAEGQAGVIFDDTTLPNLPSVNNNNTNYYVQRQLHSVMMPAAVDLTYAKTITLDTITYSQLGAAAVHFGLGVQSSAATNSTITDVSGNGIEMGDAVDPISHHPSSPGQVTQNNTVSNNTISYVGAEYHDSVGILATYTTHSVIDHNTIHDVPYSGISVGWGWALTDPLGSYESAKHAGIFEHGYLPEYTTVTTSTNNQITNNLIYHVMLLLSDGGGIYTLGRQDGTTVEGNYIHDFTTTLAHGMYLDEGTANTTWTQNVISHVTDTLALNQSIPSPNDAITGNYTDSPMSSNKSANTIVPAGTLPQNWPTAAQTIMNSAGAGH